MTLRIVPREEWGAAPPRQIRAALAWPASEVWVHHTVTNLTGDDFADMRRVQQVAFSRGFIDTSYTVAVFPSGTICDGRGLRFVGAHTKGRNSASHGIALVGNYDVRLPTAAQIDAVRWVIAEAKRVGALQPGTYPTGGHRDAPDAQTACPGSLAYARLDDMRRPWRPEEDDMTDEMRTALETIAAEALAAKNYAVAVFSRLGGEEQDRVAALEQALAEQAAKLDALLAAVTRMAGAGGPGCVVAGGVELRPVQG